jgi:hypothetical protein
VSHRGYKQRLVTSPTHEELKDALEVELPSLTSLQVHNAFHRVSIPNLTLLLDAIRQAKRTAITDAHHEWMKS